jgi:hypothetical protein
MFGDVGVPLRARYWYDGLSGTGAAMPAPPTGADVSLKGEQEMAKEQNVHAEHGDRRVEELREKYGDLADLKVEELRERAHEAGVPHPSEMKKEELLEALQHAGKASSHRK